MEVGVSHYAPPFSVMVRTNATPLRRQRADAERSFSNNEANVFAAAGCWFTAFGLSRIQAGTRLRGQTANLVLNA